MNAFVRARGENTLGTCWGLSLMPVMFVHAMCSPLAGHAFGNTCIGFTRSTSCIYQQNQNNDISVFGCDSVMAIYMRCQGSRD